MLGERSRCLWLVHPKACVGFEYQYAKLTLWKINMETNNGGFEDDVPFQRRPFFFRFHVNFPGGPRFDMNI